MTPYNPKKIEKKWQKIWEKEDTFSFQEKSKKPKFYLLDMFPYPSAEGLHVGHPEGYTATDIISRYLRMRGYNVLHPMGWDAFGLPAENFAIKSKVHPAKTTAKSIKRFKEQIRALGFSYDWSRELSTAGPDYYKWTQWLFLYLFKRGLAYRKEAPVNWCPSCKTVLANEQVINGECERCGSKVVQKMLEQWFFKITDYAERLLEGLERVDWPEKIKAMQRNWIGKSEGALLQFPIFNSQFSIEVFTTRPDTLFGATYLVLAPEHKLVDQLISLSVNQAEVKKYIKQAAKKTELERIAEAKEKTGVELEGIKAINPATKEEIPVWIADYVLGSYGTGAIMAVPAHDERDYEFAKKFKLPIERVISDGELPYTGEGIIINSGKFSEMPSEKARDEIIKFVKGKKKTTYRLRDWLISRQRYWGAPIPIVYCEKCGIQPVPEKDLPVKLPTDVDFRPKGESPLARSKSFHKVKCPKCKSSARRESDTMDTFVDSSWYFLRYIDPKSKKAIFDPKKVNVAMPVDLYVGGAEHAVLHLLYSRFITKALFDPALEKGSLREIKSPSFKGGVDGKFLKVDEPFLKLRNQGLILGPDGHRMSKSRGNVINPDDILEEYGADTFRIYEMFMGPFEDDKPWDTRSIIGVFRFLTRVWKLGGKKLKLEESEALRRKVHQTIAKVEKDITGFSFNTAVSALMILLSEIEKEESAPAFRTFLMLLYPFAPHLSAELWQKLNFGKYIHAEPWPETIAKYLREEEIKLVVQVDGRVRDTIPLPAGLSKGELIEAAKKSENVARHIAGKKIKDMIVVPNKLVNFVTK